MNFSGLTARPDAARVEWEGAASGPTPPMQPVAACCSSPAISATGKSTPWRTRQRSTDPSACWPARSTIRRCTTCSSRCEAAPATTSSTGAARSRRMLRTLQSNQGVALLIDQHIQAPDAVTVNFFDRPASTTLALAMLARRTGAAVIPVFALPIGPRPLPPGITSTRWSRRRTIAEAIRDFTQRCTDVLEMYVRRHPDLWLWMHRRWRDRRQPDAIEPEPRRPAHDDAWSSRPTGWATPSWRCRPGGHPPPAPAARLLVAARPAVAV